MGANPTWLRAGDTWDDATKTLTVNSDPDYTGNDEIIHLIISTNVDETSASREGTTVKGLYVSPGDVNGNGEVDIDDAVSILRHLVSKPNATFIEEAADVNGNGGIDIDDAVSILKYLVGKITTLPTNDGGQKGVGRRGGYDPTNDNPFN